MKDSLHPGVSVSRRLVVDKERPSNLVSFCGENVRQITRGRFDSEQAEWSPDGHQLIFTSNRTEDFKLYVVSTDGSNLRRLTSTPKGFDESSPSWTRRRLFR